MNIRIGPRSLNPISPPWNRYNRIFHALRGGKIFSRADQLCTKCNANVTKIRHSPIIMFQKYMSKGIKRLLWRIIIIFFPPSKCFNLIFEYFIPLDPILLSWIDIIKFLYILRAKNFLSDRRDIDDNSFISVLEIGNEPKFHSDFPWLDQKRL